MADKINDIYETVIGIETHAELCCNTKIFCACKTSFGDRPNTHVCPVCLGHPGALPTLNKNVVSLAVRAGQALGCKIEKLSKLDRKNYYYPDLPKSYQISQYDLPLCTGGGVDIEVGGKKKRIGITRIHIEEDAGKLIHRDGETLIDCNRCGVPLIEIVSEPDMRSAADAVEYLEKLRLILLFAGICDGKMNEGSIRFDVNLSVRKAGDKNFGARTEIKNLNSFQFTAKAIEYEAARQIEVISGGGIIERETRRFDTDKGITYAMRKKEDSADYRFFPEPDIPPFLISDDIIDREKSLIPALPDERRENYISRYALTKDDAVYLTASPELSDYFEVAANLSSFPKTVANLIISEAPAVSDEPVYSALPPSSLASLSDLFGRREINSATMKKLIRRIWNTKDDPAKIVSDEHLGLIKDKNEILSYVNEAIRTSEKSVTDYLNGKTSAKTAIIGQIMRLSHGRADPAAVDELLTAELERLR